MTVTYLRRSSLRSTASGRFAPASERRVPRSLHGRAGFTGGLVVDYPNSTKAKKYYLCLSFEHGYKTPAPKVEEPGEGVHMFQVSGARLPTNEYLAGLCRRILSAASIIFLFELRVIVPPHSFLYNFLLFFFSFFHSRLFVDQSMPRKGVV